MRGERMVLPPAGALQTARAERLAPAVQGEVFRGAWLFAVQGTKSAANSCKGRLCKWQCDSCAARSKTLAGLECSLVVRNFARAPTCEVSSSDRQLRYVSARKNTSRRRCYRAEFLSVCGERHDCDDTYLASQFWALMVRSMARAIS